MKPKELFKFNRWAVVGDVLNSGKYAYRILNTLKANGYEVVGVNPRDTSGKCHKSLKDVETNIEVIDLCINPSLGIEIVKEAKEIGISNILIQPGAASDEILQYCKDAGITAIEGCALVELS